MSDTVTVTNAKVKLEDEIRPKESLLSASVGDISGLKFKKLKNINTSKASSSNHVMVANVEMLSQNSDLLKNENLNSSPLQASTLMTPPPSLSHSNSSAGSSSAGSYNNYSGSRSVSPTSSSTTAITATATSIMNNKANKVVETMEQDPDIVIKHEIEK